MTERPPLRAGLEFVVLVFVAAGVGQLAHGIGFRLVEDAPQFGLAYLTPRAPVGPIAALGVVAGVVLGVALADRSDAVTAAGVGSVVGYFLLVVVLVVAFRAGGSVDSITETLSDLVDDLPTLLVEALAIGTGAAVAAVAGHRLPGAESTETRGWR